MAIIGKFQNAAAVTASDTVTFPATMAISLGVAGAVAVDLYGGQTNVVLTLPAGLFEIAVTRIYSTSTTATGLARYWS